LHGREAEPQGPCSMCQDSDGFAMNRLEEGALGDPVLAGNLVLYPNGRRSPQMGTFGTPPERVCSCEECVVIKSSALRQHKTKAQPAVGMHGFGHDKGCMGKHMAPQPIDRRTRGLDFLKRRQDVRLASGTFDSPD
jgi:hypothetical protein